MPSIKCSAHILRSSSRSPLSTLLITAVNSLFCIKFLNTESKFRRGEGNYETRSRHGNLITKCIYHDNVASATFNTGLYLICK